MRWSHHRQHGPLERELYVEQTEVYQITETWGIELPAWFITLGRESTDDKAPNTPSPAVEKTETSTIPKA